MSSFQQPHPDPDIHREGSFKFQDPSLEFLENPIFSCIGISIFPRESAYFPPKSAIKTSLTLTNVDLTQTNAERSAEGLFWVLKENLYA